ncbi:MAG: helix-turn-helix transcriptional regulator, partial [Eubacteriales bacterium]|nr:helix-turn-helix transcriptional regulator [Eubacteriales bacterium]
VIYSAEAIILLAKVDYKALGAQIRARRQYLHMTQAELAELAGISLQFMGNLERGLSIPSVETLVSLSYALAVTTDYLLSDSLPEDGYFDQYSTPLRSCASVYCNTLSDWMCLEEKEDELCRIADLTSLPPLKFCALDEELPYMQ